MSDSDLKDRDFLIATRVKSEVDINEENKKFFEEQQKFFTENNIPLELKNLINEISTCRKCTEKNDNHQKYLINPFQEFVGKEYFLPYTTNYWTDICFHNPADIVFIGQDWGGLKSAINYITKNREGCGNHTRKNLEAGVERIKCRNRSLYINSVMCLRDGSDTDKKCFDYEFILNCKNHVLEHLNIVKPKIIVTIGFDVTKTYLEGNLDRKGNNVKFYDISSQPYWDSKYKWFIFPIYHLGSRGQANRKMYGSRGKYIPDNYLGDFDLIKLLLISIYITNCLQRYKDNNVIWTDIENSLVQLLPEYTDEVNEKIAILKNANNIDGLHLKNKFEDIVLLIYNNSIKEYYDNYRNSKKVNANLSKSKNLVFNKDKTYWFINVGEIDDSNQQVRCWEDNKKYGFVSFGHGGINLNLKDKIKPGDYVFIYINKIGYVGCGEVLDKAKEVDEFKNINGLGIYEMNMLVNKGYLIEKDDSKREYFVSIKWDKALDKKDPIWLGNNCNYRQTFCRFQKKSIALLERLIKEFNMK